MARYRTSSQVEAKRVNDDSRATSGLARRCVGYQKDVRPFLKGAGGKRQLLPEIRRFYPDSFGAYYEPFVGSGAVCFDLYNRGLLSGRKAVLIDNNADATAMRTQYDAMKDRYKVVYECESDDPAAAIKVGVTRPGATVALFADRRTDR